MPLFRKKDQSTGQPTPNVESRGTRMSWPAQENNIQQRPSVQHRPRSILRNSSAGQQQVSDPRRHSVAAPSSARVPTTRDRFQSMPASNSLSALSAQQRSGGPGTGLAASTSLSRLNTRSPAECTYDTESDRLDRACGQGPWTQRPTMDRSRKSSRSSMASRRSRSCSLSRDPSRRQSQSNQKLVRFPQPPIQHAIRDLSHILRDRTKNFRIMDYLEPEEIKSGRIWEEEEETLVDCVRDRPDDGDGQDGIWRLERRKRLLRREAEREMTRRDGNVFGAHLQDLATTAMTRVVVCGYIHVVPMVADACIEEVYRRGVYEYNLFRSLPDRSRLLYLIAKFDGAAKGMVPLITNHRRDSITYAKTQSLQHEQIPDVCATLVTYLTALPDPLIHRSLSDALWAWCVSPSVIRQEQHQRRRGDDEASESDYETSEDEDEDAPSYNTRLRQMEREYMNLPSFKVQILIVQRLLLLLPPRHFSLLVHLLDFFATLLVYPENGLGLEDIGRIFGPMIVGGKMRKQPKHEIAKTKDVTGPEREKNGKEKRSLMWLVNHWKRISVAYEPDGAGKNTPRRARSVSVSERGEKTGGDMQQQEREKRIKDGAPQMISDVKTELPIRSVSQHPRRQSNAMSPNLNVKITVAEPRPPSTISGSSTSSDSDLPEVQIPQSKHLHPDKKISVHGATKNYKPSYHQQTPVWEHPLVASRRRSYIYPAGDDNSICSISSEDAWDSIVRSYYPEPVDDDWQSDHKQNSAVVPSHLDTRDSGSDGEGRKLAADRKLERENARLREQLEQLAKERDEAKSTVAAMRRIMREAT